MRARPSSRAPVPQSNTTRVPASEISSTQDVLPPYRTVPGPGEAVDPRVPQKRTRTSDSVVPRERRGRYRLGIQWGPAIADPSRMRADEMAALDRLPVAVAVLRDGVVVGANAVAQRMFGVPA